jgi:hypothetical protein
MRSRPASRSTSAQRTASTSPRRAPVVAARSSGISQEVPSAARTSWRSCSAVGTSSRGRSGFGGRTAWTGFVVTRPQATAWRMAWPRTARACTTVRGASPRADTASMTAWTLRAVAGNGGLAVETSVRDVAASLGAGKDAVAAALSRPARLGLVRCETQRAAGRYAGSAYLLEVDACRRAGLVLHAPSRPASPCLVQPCLVQPVTAQRVAALPGGIAAARSEGESSPASLPARPRAPLPQSLFDLSDPSPSSPTLSSPDPASRPTP